MVHAMRTGRNETIADGAAAFVLADLAFTTPADILRPLTGLWRIHAFGYSRTEPWLIAAYLLYLL